MYLSFYILAVITSVLFASLAFVWLFMPRQFLSAWGTDRSDSIELVGRRAAALYAGISVMFFIARNVEEYATREALVYGIITTCIMLAFLGIYEFIKGRAGKGILAGVFIEIILSLLFMSAR